MVQIEQMGKALAKILAELVTCKTNDMVEYGIDATKKQFISELDVDIDMLLTLPKAEMNTYLTEHKVNVEHFSIVQEYFQEIGESKIATDKAVAKVYLTKSLELLELIDEITKKASYVRIFIKSEVNDMLKQCI